MASPVVVAVLGEPDDHRTSPGHPERPARLEAVDLGVGDALGNDVERLTGRDVTRDEMCLVHDGAYLDALAGMSAAGGGSLDIDTEMSGGTWSTATRAAGTGLAAIEALDRGDGVAAFVAVRPPGHHALRAQGMGFCFLNNVAIAAATLTARGERVLIVDWDVHHGNGTQALFWDDPNVLYASTHQWPAYPGTGHPDETGGPNAPGLTVNVPLPPGATGDVVREAIERVVAPAAAEFAPTWLLISAGFDAHRDDPLADLALSSGDFADLTASVLDLLPWRGRTVAFLEGGYDLDALRRSVEACVSTLAGAPVAAEAATSGGPGRDAVQVAAEAAMRGRERRG